MKQEPSLHQLALRSVDIFDGRQAARIDAFVAERPEATLFHRPAWLRAIERGCGQKAQYLIAENAAGALVGLLPLTLMHHPLFGRALVSSGFGVDGGIVADSDRAYQALADQAREMAQQLSIGSVELRGGTERLSSEWQRISDKHVGYAFDLAEDDDAQLTFIKRKQRAEVRRGLDYDLAFETGNGDAIADVHYALYAASVRNLGTPVFPRPMFDAMRAEFGEDAEIELVRSPEGDPLAAVFSFYHKGVVMPYWGGGDVAARHWRANEVIYYRIACHARERGCHRFDFGRSKVGSGSGRFKKNWGLEAEPLTYAMWSADGAERNVDPTSGAYAMLVDMWKRLPLPVANRIGPWLSRGLG